MTAIAQPAKRGRPLTYTPGNVLPLKSLRWAQLAESVHAYLQVNPGRADEVRRGMRHRYPQEVVNDCLAWLQLHGMATCDEPDWIWRAAEISADLSRVDDVAVMQGQLVHAR